LSGAASDVESDKLQVRKRKKTNSTLRISSDEYAGRQIAYMAWIICKQP